MTKFFALLSAAFLLITVADAQTKTPPKTDTAKTKATPASRITVDTLNQKFQLALPSYKFDKIDSADLTLTAAVPITRYGFVDTADLKMKTCEFETGANAMVLFDRAEMAFGIPNIIMERQKRIKIFNDNGKGEGNIRIEYNNRFGAERIIGVEAETINLVNGKIVYTKLDPKLVYGEHTDKNKDAVLFSMPEVRAGSVIEYRYVWERALSRNFPGWDFQCNLPTRYSQFDVFINPVLKVSALYRKDQPFVKDTVSMGGFGHIWALGFIPSLKKEPYMRSPADVTQGLSFIINSISAYGMNRDLSSSWAEVGKQLWEDKSITKPFEQSLHDEDDLIKQAKTLKNDDEKIAFLFNQVKTLMKWNQEENWVSKDGIKNAWKKKSGNWGEINMILYHLLKKEGLQAYPMVVSTRDNGMMLPGFVNIYQINKLVTYVPVDSTKYYVLDATDKFNSYNEVPFDLLNSYGLFMDKDRQKYELVFMKKDAPVQQVVFVQAAINTDGTMTGSAQLNNSSYSKAATLQLHKELDESKYKEFLTGNDNNLKITSLELQNAEVDSLPLTQNIVFRLDLPGTDDKYIYFNPNLFTSLHDNPFISQDRQSDIDFGCSNIYSINGRYKIPAGYKVDAMPKSMNLVNPDKSVTFKRIVGQEDDVIVVFYVINYKKAIYKRSDYPGLHDYFKKMNEILNEQIVLKKL